MVFVVQSLSDISLKKFFTLVLLIYLHVERIKGDTSVKIKSLLVPEVVELGSRSSVVLDCDYSLDDPSGKAAGLVVKWFFNRHPSPVYQWIQNKRPQDLGVLKGRLNLDYRASSDATKMYRALEIVNVTTELSGEYQCQVSTFYNEDRQAKKMVILVPEKELVFTTSKEGNMVNLTCSAEGVYPEPNMTIQSSDRTHSGEYLVDKFERDGVYDIIARLEVSEEELDSPTNFDCDLEIPEAKYSKRKSFTYQPRPLSSTPDPLVTLTSNAKHRTYLDNRSSNMESVHLVWITLLIFVFVQLH
nr:PREDICTED: uncharacterized protein LOC109037368 isoform X1 [Bemisia tabaci]